jgi:hypothetical protein
MQESFSADAFNPRKQGGTHGIQGSSMTPRTKHAFAAGWTGLRLAIGQRAFRLTDVAGYVKMD